MPQLMRGLGSEADWEGKAQLRAFTHSASHRGYPEDDQGSGNVAEPVLG